MLRLIIIALVLVTFTTAYSLQCKSYSIQYKKSSPTYSSTLLYASSSPPLDDITKDKIELIISTNKVVLFMKGNKAMPQWYKYIHYFNYIKY